LAGLRAAAGLVDHVLVERDHHLERRGAADDDLWLAARRVIVVDTSGDATLDQDLAFGYRAALHGHDQPLPTKQWHEHIPRLARRWNLVFCQVEGAMKWRAALEAGGAVYKRTCQWIKPDGKPQYSGDRPGIGYESIVACHAPGRTTWNGGGSHGVFIMNKSGDPRTGHQTQKPLALMEQLVRLFSDQGELILDPFTGSGTTGVAAVRLGRRFVGWEMNPVYSEMARRRLAAAREQLEIGF
jgi:hypothetical protein